MDTQALKLLVTLQIIAPTFCIGFLNNLGNSASVTDVGRPGAVRSLIGDTGLLLADKEVLRVAAREGEGDAVEAGRGGGGRGQGKRRLPDLPSSGTDSSGRPPSPPPPGDSQDGDNNSVADDIQGAGKPPPPPRTGAGIRGGRLEIGPPGEGDMDSQPMMHRGRRDVEEAPQSDDIGIDAEIGNSVDVGNETETPVKINNSSSPATPGSTKHPPGGHDIPGKAGCYRRWRGGYPVYLPPPTTTESSDDDDEERLQAPMRRPRMRNRGGRSRGKRSPGGVGPPPSRKARGTHARAHSSSSSGGWSASTSTTRLEDGVITSVATSAVDDGHGHVKVVRDVQRAPATGGAVTATAIVSSRSGSGRASTRVSLGTQKGRKLLRSVAVPEVSNHLPSKRIDGAPEFARAAMHIIHDTLQPRLVDDNSVRVNWLEAPRTPEDYTDYLHRHSPDRKKREVSNVLPQGDAAVDPLRDEQQKRPNILDYSLRELVKRCVGGSGAGAEVAKEGIRAGRAAIEGGVEVAKLLVQAFRELGQPPSSRRKRGTMDNVKKNMNNKLDVTLSRVNEYVMNVNEKMDNTFGDSETYVKGKETIMEGIGQVLMAAAKLSTSSSDESSRRRREAPAAPKPKRGKEAILARIYADMDNMPGKRRAKLVAASREELSDPDPEPSSQTESPLRAKRQARVFAMGAPLDGDTNGGNATEIQAAHAARPRNRTDPIEKEMEGSEEEEEDDEQGGKNGAPTEQVPEASIDLASELGLKRRRRRETRSRRDIIDDLKEIRDKVIRKGKELMERAKLAMAKAMNKQPPRGQDSDPHADPDDMPQDGGDDLEYGGMGNGVDTSSTEETPTLKEDGDLPYSITIPDRNSSELPDERKMPGVSADLPEGPKTVPDDATSDRPEGENTDANPAEVSKNCTVSPVPSLNTTVLDPGPDDGGDKSLSTELDENWGDSLEPKDREGKKNETMTGSLDEGDEPGKTGAMQS